MKICLRIDELMFHGFDYNDGKQMHDSFEKELTRLIAEGGFPKSIGTSSETSNLDLGSLIINTDANPQNVGVKLAKSIYNEWNRCL